MSKTEIYSPRFNPSACNAYQTPSLHSHWRGFLIRQAAPFAIDLNGNNDNNSPMQSLNKSGVGVTITRAASQQMMHLSLADNEDNNTPQCGVVYSDHAGCINRVAAFAQPPQQKPNSCGIWISHFGTTKQSLLSLCQQQSGDHNTFFLLLDLSIKGRMDLRAVRLDQQHQQLHPITISMIEA
ncbi:MAG: hypothetical protein R8J85_04750 [Mariprofundales bacterium]